MAPTPKNRIFGAVKRKKKPHGCNVPRKKSRPDFIDKENHQNLGNTVVRTDAASTFGDKETSKEVLPIIKKVATDAVSASIECFTEQQNINDTREYCEKNASSNVNTRSEELNIATKRKNKEEKAFLCNTNFDVSTGIDELNIETENKHYEKNASSNVNTRSEELNIATKRKSKEEKAFLCNTNFDVSTGIDELNIETENKHYGSSEKLLQVEGRRIVDFQHLFDQLIEISRHSQRFSCQLNFLKIVKETNNGLRSTFKLRCFMCGSEFNLNTCADGDKEVSDINHSAVSGTILIGCGRANFNELAASMDLPSLSESQYAKCHSDLHGWWKTTAEATMKEAAKEETDNATEKSPSGIPMISVTADACWCKRSYKKNYSSLAGVGAIIGLNSGKALSVEVKNKYCVICARSKNKAISPPEHQCNINHRGSSSSMEQAAIVEGFKKSVEQHNLIYSKLIADGDASTYKNILESRPYPNVTVQKIECSNHLMRNYNGKNLNLVKETSIPLSQRKLLTTDRINRLRVAVKSAVRFRKAQNCSFPQMVQNLRTDILNSPKHVFGDHAKCETYYCSAEKKEEPNLVPQIPVLMAKLMTHATALSNHAQSLLHNLNNNRAEQFNAIVAKHVGGKRVNYGLKDSYELRCYAAVVAYNTGRPIYTLHKTIGTKSPSVAVKKFELRKQKQNTKKKTWKPKRRLDFVSENADYGETCQKPDMTDEEYETAKTLYLENLKVQVQDKDAIEKDTVLQAESALWLELRRCLLTASNFAKVCKRRSNISSAPLVRSLLYSYSLDRVAAIQHGKKYEVTASKQLAIQENIQVQRCGLYIDSKHFFLGASPDGVFDDGIIEIKCPISAFNMSANEAINQKKIKMWKKEGNSFVINKNCDWYYQVQGQLHITQQQKCLFAVWTSPDHQLKIEIIEKDDEFWAQKMEKKLVDFYYKCMLPEIVNSRKARSMPIRDTAF